MRPDTSSSSSRPGFGTRLFRAFRNLVIFSLVVGLMGATGYVLSMLNSRTYTLQVIGGQLVVMKGKMLPMGMEPWLPADSALADAYAPLDLSGNTALSVVGPKYADRDELDRAMFIVIDLLARPRVQSDSPADLERGLAYLRRGQKLSGLTDEQKLSLKRMQSDVALSLARVRLDDARRQLEEAVEQLKLAADTDTKHTREANQMLLSVEPQVKQLSDTLRAAVHQLSTPPPTKVEPKVEPGPAKVDPIKPDVPPAVAPNSDKPAAPEKAPEKTEAPPVQPLDSQTATRP